MENCEGGFGPCVFGIEKSNSTMQNTILKFAEGKWAKIEQFRVRLKTNGLNNVLVTDKRLRRGVYWNIQ